MTVPVANCRDPAALLVRMIYQASRNHPSATILGKVMISTRIMTAELINLDEKGRDLFSMLVKEGRSLTRAPFSGSRSAQRLG